MTLNWVYYYGYPAAAGARVPHTPGDICRLWVQLQACNSYDSCMQLWYHKRTGTHNIPILDTQYVANVPYYACMQSAVCASVFEIMFISDADGSVNSQHLTCTGLWALLDHCCPCSPPYCQSKVSWPYCWCHCICFKNLNLHQMIIMVYYCTVNSSNQELLTKICSKAVGL